MQDKFVADEGDFGKYGLLRTLAGIEPEAKPGYRIGVVWYLRPEVKLSYLRKPEYHGYDEELFGVLLDIVDSQTRTVEEIRKREILGKDADFFTKHVPIRRKRDEWLRQALEETRDARIVLLDPDNALELCERDEKEQLSTKHAYLDEVRPFVQRGQTVVTYQSFGQGRGDTRAKQVRRWHDECLTKLSLEVPPRIVKTSTRAFIILPATHHAEHVVDRLDVLVERWGDHFKRWELE